MLLSERRNILLTFLALPLAACGFTPVLGAGSVARSLQGNLRFNLIDSREGFLLLEQLESRFGTAGASARFNVKIGLNITDNALVLTAATGLTRHTLTGFAKINVVPQATDKSVFSDELRETVGYTSGAETLATESSKKDAYRRLVRALADAIALRLSASAESWAG